jgi:hypothetical protein
MKKVIPLLLFMSVFFVRPLSGQVDSLQAKYAVTDTQDVKVTLFDTDDLFEISLKFDLNKYKRARSDTMYLDAVLTYHINKTDSISKNIKVRARGNIRRTAPEICDFPPLMLNFHMKDDVGTEFAGINKLKIVPYCKIGYEQYVLKEYLVYKLYNVLTDYSLRVRLFKITYLNSVKEKKPIIQFGFAIEPVSLMEKRTKTKELNYAVTQRNLRPDMLDRTAIFNYMIGNPDWSVPIKHNVVLLTTAKIAPANENLIVAYDFDYSGIVGTSYAIPFPNLPIKTVQERLYMAVCRTETEFTNALNEFLEKKDEFYKVINDFPYLNEKSKKTMTNYLDGFFYGMDKRNSLLKKLLSDCLWFEDQANLKVR